jgi:hypothetical protein
LLQQRDEAADQNTCTGKSLSPLAATTKTLMNASQIPFSHLFFGLGLIVILRCYYDQRIGPYYTGQPTLTFSDTIREKVRFTKGGKGVSDKYHMQLSFDKAKFVITDNGTQLIRGERQRRETIESLNAGDPVTIRYASDDDRLINTSSETVKVLELVSEKGIILPFKAVQAADKRDIRNWNIAGALLLVCGGVFYYVRKRKK